MTQEPPAWLQDVSAPTRSLREVLEENTHLVSRVARRMGLPTSDMRALRLLGQHGPMGASELAQRLDLRPASVTALLDRLEVQGHLERVRHEDDHRRVTIRALPHALQDAFVSWAPVVRAMDEAGQGLSEAEQQVVCAYLSAVSEAMRRG